jgi:hypothetical protein
MMKEEKSRNLTAGPAPAEAKAPEAKPAEVAKAE